MGLELPSERIRDRSVRRVLWVVLAVNLGVAATKLVVGKLVGSLALTTDALHSTLDGASNVVGLIGLWVGTRPPDREHPYGHRRFETLAAAFIGLLIAAGLTEIVKELIAGLRGSRPIPEVHPMAIAAVVLTIFANVGISAYERRKARQLSSSLLEADASHTLSDAMAAVVVLLSFGALYVGWVWADLVATTVICLFIAVTAWQILKKNIGSLVDRAQLDPHEIHRIAMSVRDVAGAHRIRSRASGDHIQVDLHIHLDPNMPLQRAHEIAHRVVTAIREHDPRISEVLVHTEPADGREQDFESIAPM